MNHSGSPGICEMVDYTKENYPKKARSLRLFVLELRAPGGHFAAIPNENVKYPSIRRY